jgi:hypothetical protein
LLKDFLWLPAGCVPKMGAQECNLHAVERMYACILQPLCDITAAAITAKSLIRPNKLTFNWAAHNLRKEGNWPCEGARLTSTTGQDLSRLAARI